jgi:hypothetical protein
MNPYPCIDQNDLSAFLKTIVQSNNAGSLNYKKLSNTTILDHTITPLFTFKPSDIQLEPKNPLTNYAHKTETYTQESKTSKLHLT